MFYENVAQIAQICAIVQPHHLEITPFEVSFTTQLKTTKTIPQYNDF